MSALYRIRTVLGMIHVICVTAECHLRFCTLYKLLLHEVRKLIFKSNLRFVLTVLLARTLYDIKCVAALLIHPRKVTQIYIYIIHVYICNFYIR